VALPNVIVIGAMKCGTSSLHYYLDLHPEISMSSPKELDFFLGAADREGAGNWHRGLEWYESHFDPAAPVRGESSPNYSAPPSEAVADRMARVVPDARLVFLARHPIERIVSHYLHMWVGGHESKSLPEAISTTKDSYIDRTRYARMVGPFLERYPRDRILFLRAEELLRQRRDTMRRTFGFLGVDDSFWSEKMERLRQPTASKGRLYALSERLRASPMAAPIFRLGPEAKWYLERLLFSRPKPIERPTIPPDLRRSILAELEGDIAELERITGWDLTTWRS
jgi:hypothetical protein